MIKIVLIDDHDVVREGLAKLLINLGNFEISKQYSNGLDFLEDFESIKKDVDIFILDYSMPKLNGFEILEKIQDKIIDAKFLILSQSIDEFLKYKFYLLGARGFLPKNLYWR